MKLYARILLCFALAIERRLRSTTLVEAFAFGTRLTRLTPELRGRNPRRAIAQAISQVTDFGGGTRTGEALRSYNRNWSPRIPGAPVVLVVSDGWDRGNIELLEREIGHLARTSCQLWWLNPLLGDVGYEPLTRGIRAALRHVDQHLPIHNLHSLQQLGDRLADAQPRLP